VCFWKCRESGKGSRVPPSSERDIWIFVSLVMRERAWRRRGRELLLEAGDAEVRGSGTIEPILLILFDHLRSMQVWSCTKR
jgi:hypothetical protein